MGNNNDIMGVLQWHLHISSDPTDSGLNWNLVVLVFKEGGKPENPEKNLTKTSTNHLCKAKDFSQHCRSVATQFLTSGLQQTPYS